MKHALTRIALVTFTALAGATAFAEQPDLIRRVEQLGIELAQQQVQGPDRFVVDTARFGGADPVPPGELKLYPVSTTGPNASGMVVVRVSLVVDGMPRGEARVNVRGKVFGPALIARTTLRGGHPIDFVQVERADAELTRVSGSPVRSVNELLARVPLRSLGAGRVLTDELLVPEPTVRRGETADLVLERGGLRLRTTVVARRDGTPGQTIPVRNVASGIELMARVRPDGSLTAVGGARR